jgi:hypothetical protein
VGGCRVVAVLPDVSALGLPAVVVVGTAADWTVAVLLGACHALWWLWLFSGSSTRASWAGRSVLWDARFGLR